MLNTTRDDVVSVDAELLETLVAGAEAPVSGAPLPTPPVAHIIVIGIQEPKEPKDR
ncbi:hypothetical protein [Streptomyces sp. WELS2]|uniref:hypothetical protein n=1 Tax=Streptomyces sp. WELS2 TaxID=2749435 RepID=UPI0015F00DA3|nr:hypothetical protein [Streptomyces sp. WELS2]